MTPKALTKINPLLGAVGFLAMAGVLVLVISFTQHNAFPWVAFLSGILLAAILALAYRLTVTNRTVAALRVDLRRFEEDFPVMVAYAGDDEVVRSHNRAFREWLRLRRELVDGHALREVMGNTTYQQFKPGIDHALRGRFVPERQVYVDSDRRLHLYVQNIPRKNDQGQVVGFFLTLVEVSGFGSLSDTRILPAQPALARPQEPAPSTQVPSFEENTIMMSAPAGRARPAHAARPATAPKPAHAVDLEVQPAPVVTDFLTPAPARAPVPMQAAGCERQTFVKTMTEELTSWKNAGDRLRAAIDNDEFCLYAQEIKPVLGGKAQATLYELLLRLQEEEEGLMPPGAFIPIAEEHGMLPDLDRWVVGHILDWISRKPARQSVIYSVNVSGPTLAARGFPEFVALALQKYKVGGSLLCFEIAEADAIADVAIASEVVTKLAALGCHTAICGFGQAAGSYSLIKKMPVDYIKIDGSIVMGATRNTVDLTKLKAIARVAHATHRSTVAEFVENVETLQVLGKLGVDLAQGFGISKPVPLSRLD
jgi:EAL domain-containing protein (putative c-di-GMP-specific phosphodiesterase class I)